MLISLVRLAIQELRASGNLRRWMRLVSADVDGLMAGTLPVPGTVYEIRFPLGLTTAQSNTILVNDGTGPIIHSAELEINTAYTAGTLISIGYLLGLANLMGTADNTPQVLGLYQVPQDSTIGATPASPIIATISGVPPLVGAATVIVRYSYPLT